MHLKVAICAALAAVSLGACEQRRHPEAFVKVLTGVGGDVRVLSYSQGGYVSVEGSWSIEGDDKIATPVNVSKIECLQSENQCVDYRAQLMTMSGSTYLSQDRDFYRISSWDAKQVVAIFVGPCRTIELKIDIPANSVITVTSNNPGQTRCEEIVGPMKKPRVSRLIGSDELERIRKSGGF